jgi:hypothetical protein
MRKRNQIELLAGARGAKTLSDDLVQFSNGKELRGRQFADRDNEARAQNFELAIEPRGTAGDFLRVGNAIAPAGSLSRKTATDLREIDFRPDHFFRQAAPISEPAKKRFARGPCERFPGGRFARAWRLSDYDHLA